ncbi:MAG: O-antigen ligase family protein [Candidatus Tectimicrobiota bacterium]
MLVFTARFRALACTLDRSVQALLVSFVLFVPLSISLMQASYILAVTAWLLGLYLRASWRQVRLPCLWPVLGFILVSVLCTIVGVAPRRGLIELRNVLEIVIFYLAVNQIPSTERAARLTDVLVAVGTVIALHGLVQSFSHGASFRVHGTMSIYMTFAGLLMLMDLMALAQVLYQSHRRQMLWYMGAVLCLTSALLMTQTRGAWIGLLGGGCVLLALRHKFLLLALPLMLGLGFFLVPAAIQGRVLSLFDRQNITAQERLSMWRSGWHMWRDAPLLGIGLGAVAEVYPRYREPDSLISPTRHLGHLHNNVVQMAVERGLLGLLCWLGIWVAYLYHVWHIYRRLAPADTTARALVIGSAVCLLAFHLEGMFEHTFGDSEVISLVYFLMALPFVVQRTRHATAPA